MKAGKNWSKKDVATANYMWAMGVAPTVLAVRDFFIDNPHLKIEKPEAAVALKLRDIHNEAGSPHLDPGV